MEQLQNFGDERQLAWCIHCGGATETRDHVPSRVFLNEPYPSNLPVVPSCLSCNRGFSKDEEYLACLADCVRLGSVNASAKHRPKIARILTAKPALASRLAKARRETIGGVIFDVETDRVRNVVLKLARGHAAFELNEPQRDDPARLTFGLLSSMQKDVRKSFETPPYSSTWPEVGSRAMQRMVVASKDVIVGWVIVQPGLYRYIATVGESIIVRMVIGEYLACEVAWALG